MRALSLLAIVSLAAGTPPPVQSSPAQRRMARARSGIEQAPNNYQSHNALAAALLGRARETGDASFLTQAQAEVERSLNLQKDNFDARKIEAGIVLARDEYAR